MATDPPTVPPNTSDTDDGLSTGGVIAIAAVGVLLLIVVAAGVHHSHRQHGKTASSGKQRDWHKAQVLMRIGLCCLICFSLSIADIPQVIPPGVRIYPGLIGSRVIVNIPTLMYTLLGAIPTMMMVFLVAFAATTAMLRTVPISDGLLVGMFATWSLWVSSLHWGKRYEKTTRVANVILALSGVLTLSYRPLVQEQGAGVVTDMWTEQGLENPLAVWSNAFIALCWGLAVVAFVIALPPFWTCRRLLGQYLLPQIFIQISAVLSGANVDLKPLKHAWNSLGDEGSAADRTQFEWRLFRYWGEDLVTPLKKLICETDHLILKSLLFYNNEENGNIVRQDSMSLLTACGDALSSNEDEKISRLSSWHKADRSISRFDATCRETFRALYVDEGVHLVKDKTLAYLEAFNHPGHFPINSMERLKRILKSLAIVIIFPLVPLKRLFEALTIPFMPSKWNLKAFVWTLEMVVGYTGLFAMSVYWKAYANFRIVPKDGYVGPVYHGWQLSAFSSCLLPTTEGTVKKAFQRVLGICFGGFLAWLAIIVCSWSYDDDAPINPYGMVAWLTVTTTIAAYFFSIDPGLAAHKGKSRCHGVFGNYLIYTQALIALEVFLGESDKNGLVLNRIIANTTGVLLAAVIAWIPPYRKGTDPKHMKLYLEKLDEAFALLLETFVDENLCCVISSDEFDSFLDDAAKQRKYASFLWTNASQLESLPILKGKQEYEILMERMAVVEATICHLREYLARKITSGEDMSFLRNQIKVILGNGSYSEQASSMERADSIQTDIVLTLSQRIQTALQDFHDAFDIL